MNFIVNSNNIIVTQDKDGVVTKIGSIVESCCNTNIIVKGVQKPVVFENEKGKGGFISKQKHIMDFIDAFKLIYKNEELKERLSKVQLNISKKELEDGTYKSKL